MHHEGLLRTRYISYVFILAPSMVARYLLVVSYLAGPDSIRIWVSPSSDSTPSSIGPGKGPAGPWIVYLHVYVDKISRTRTRARRSPEQRPPRAVLILVTGWHVIISDCTTYS